MEPQAQATEVLAEFRYERALLLLVDVEGEVLTLDLVGGERVLVRRGVESRTAVGDPFTLTAPLGADPWAAARLRALLEACAVLAEPVTLRAQVLEGAEDAPARWELTVCRTGDVVALR